MDSSIRLSVAIMFDRLSKQIMNFSVVVVVVVVWLLHRPVVAFYPSSNVWCNDKPNIIFKKKTTSTSTSTASPRRRNPPTLISGTSRDDTLSLFLRRRSSSSFQNFGDDDDKDKVNERIASSSRRMGSWNSTRNSAGNKMTTISDDGNKELQQQGMVIDMDDDDDELQQDQEQQQLVNRTSLSSWKKASLVYLGLLGCCMPLRNLRSIRVSLVSIYLITPFLKKRNSMTKLGRISLQAFWILYCINIPLLEVYFICRTYFDNNEESVVRIPLARSRRSRRREAVLISLLYVFATCSAIFKEKGSILLVGTLFVLRLLSYLRSSGDGNGSYSPWWAQRIVEIVDDIFNGILAII